MFEILITVGILGFAAYIMFNRFKKKASSGCGCGNCSEPKKKTR